MNLIFLLPGNRFTGAFLDSWTLLFTMPSPAGLGGEGVQFIYNREFSSDIYACRNNLVRRHPESHNLSRVQVLDGYDYDYMVWIDSDQQFFGRDIMRLVNHDVDIVSGVIPLGANQKTCLGKYREENGQKYISYYSMRGLYEEERNEKGLVEVDFTGFGFLVVKRGVFEKLEYPWFQTVIHNYGGNRVVTSEDIGWCSRIRDLGYKIYVDPAVRIGHEKEVILQAENYGEKEAV